MHGWIWGMRGICPRPPTNREPLIKTFIWI